MVEHIAVIGLGSRLARLLEERGAEVIAIDSEMDKIEEIKDVVSVAVCLNACNERSLRAQELQEVNAAVVCIGEDFQSNLLATVLLKKIGVKRVISRAANAIERQILKEVGADEVIIPEEEMAREISTRLTSKSILDMIPVSANLSAVRIKAPKAFWGHTLAELQLRSNYGINIIAIFRENQEDLGEDPFPKPETRIEAGHSLLVIGYQEKLALLEKLE